MKKLQFGLNLLLLLIIVISIESCKKQEKNPPLDALRLDSDTLFRKGQSYVLTYFCNPPSRENLNISWESSNKDIISIDNGGTIKAIGTGTAIITLRANDGSGLISSKTMYVFEKPKVSIASVTEITYYSANLLLKSDFGGGNSTNSSCGFIWDTIPKLTTAKIFGNVKYAAKSDNYNVDLFDSNRKYYVRAYVKTPLDTVYSDSIVIQTLPLPLNIVGNYMLNIPLSGGPVAKYRDWIYFVSIKDTLDSYTNGKLYRIKEDLSIKQRISDATRVNSLNIVGSNLYCSGVAKSLVSQSSIMRMKLDGSQFSLFGNDIFNNKYTTWGPMLVVNNNIYPSFGSYFSISTDIKSTIAEIGGVQYVNYYNNKLYFFNTPSTHNNDSLYTINESNLDGSELKELYRGYHFYVFAGNGNLGINDNNAYFIEKRVFKKFNLNSPNIIDTIPISTYNYNITNGAIFFSNLKDNEKLYKYDLVSKAINKITDYNVSFISVIDDWLYFNNNHHLYRIKQDGTGKQLID